MGRTSRYLSTYRLPPLEFSALPDSAGVILAASDDCVPLVVEGTREDLVSMTFEHLQTLAAFHIPQSCCFVGTSSENLRPLWIEADLGNLTLVSDQNG